MDEERAKLSVAEREIRERIEAERARLRAVAGLAPSSHFHRPAERPLSADERKRVTILFGGLTWKHEELIRAVFLGTGYHCERLPEPDVSAFQLGKEYGNNGQCSPTYFTVGNLVKYLQSLEASGMARQEILDNYVFFTAGSCGPCRFGMYEAEYRFALKNVGFDGFRVLLIKDTDGLKAASGGPGLKFTVDFGMGMVNALHLSDVMNDLIYQIRPFETREGEADRALAAAMEKLATTLRDRPPFEVMQHAPAWTKGFLAKRKKLRNTLNTLGKIREHLYGDIYREALRDCAGILDSVEVDRLRVKPVVKITGEFWAQTTEGDGNFRMFAFLEREGAQVMMEPVSTWIDYLLYEAKANAREIWPVTRPHREARWWEVRKHLENQKGLRRKLALVGAGEALWRHFYRRVAARLGGIAHPLVPQAELAALARPFYNPFARGGEGHLEVGKNVYYTAHRLCHMVLSLKPFGCMPSLQSDGVQAAVVDKYKDMIFLPIETSGEGEVNAHSRVQMALGEAKAKAKREFEEALASTGKSLDEIKAYIDEHPELRRPFYPVPHRPGIAGTAAQFVLHVSERMAAEDWVGNRSRARVTPADVA